MIAEVPPSRLTLASAASSIPSIVVGGLLAVWTFGYRYLSFVEFSNDHFVHLSTAQQITQGALPVRDFVERGLPLMSLMSAAAQVALGDGLRSEVMLVAAAFAAGAVITYLVAVRLSGSTFVAAASTLLPVLVYPVTYSYPKLLAPAIGFIAAWSYCVKPSKARVLLLAVAIVVAFLFRHDLGFFLAAGSVVLMTVFNGMRRDTFSSAGRLSIFCVALAAPYLIWVQIHEGIATYVRDGVAFSSREAERANWWQPLPFDMDSKGPFLTRLVRGPIVNVRWQPNTSDAQMVEAEGRHGIIRDDFNSPMSWQYQLTRWAPRDLERLVKDPLVADTQGIDRSAFRLDVPGPEGVMRLLVHIPVPGEGLQPKANSFAALFYVVWLLPLAAIVALAGTWRRSTPTVRAMVAMMVIVQLAMNATMLRDPLTTRLRDVLVPAALLLAYLMGLAWRGPRRADLRAACRVAVALLLVVVVAGAAAVGEASTPVERMRLADGIPGVRARLRTLRRTLAPPDHRTGPRSPSYQPLVAYITTCTQPKSRLLTMTFAPELFFYTGRGFAGGQVSMTAGYFTDDRNVALVLERLSHEDVPLVIMDNETQDEMLRYPRYGAYVGARYHEIGRFGVGVGKDFILMAENGRPSVKSFGDRHLPCFVG